MAEFTAEALFELVQAIIAERESPFGRLIRPMDVARLCNYLLSDASGIVTGSCIDYSQRVMGMFPPETGTE